MTESAPAGVAELEDRLSEPSDAAIRAVGELKGDLIVLGAGGKMGPTLSRMARRASDAAGANRRVIAVSRFSSHQARETLEAAGVETIAADLLDERAVEKLPDAALVVHMAGFKFGASEDPPRTWAMNCLVPALICRRYATSRMAAFSTGNVYGLVTAAEAGSREEDAPRPVGEYAMAALGRERIFQYFSSRLNLPLVLLRLNYAVEMRYGVLVDLAKKIWEGEAVDLAMGFVNVLWQADASAWALAALSQAAVPCRTLNLVGPERLRVRQVCESLARRMGKQPQFLGREAPDALLSDGTRAGALFGAPRVTADTLIEWTADWVMRGGETLNKPTHFESREGRF